MINKQIKLDIDLKDKNFIILNFSLFLSNNDIKYYLNKNNINFRIKDILNSNNEILNSYNFYKSNIFLNLNIDKKCTKNIIKFSFKLYKKEVYDIKKITFGLCEENVSWNNNFEILFFLKNSFFNTTNIIIDFYN